VIVGADVHAIVFSDMVHVRRPSLANVAAVELPMAALIKTAIG
jgi:hypothetical protein